jgi:hypothetical protein
MRKAGIFLFFIVLISIVSKAQDSLAFRQSSYTVLNTDTSQSFTIEDTIYNEGPTVFSGSVTFAARANGTLLNSSQFVSDSVIPAVDSLQAFGGSSKGLRFTIINNYDTAPPFIVNPIGVVIWPIINSGATPTPAFDSIYITAYHFPLGLLIAPLAKMYLFQTTDHLNINFGDADNLVQQVRIYDILGRGMYTGTADRSKDINTAGWNSGIYLCEITTYSGEKRTIKFRLQ